jgi:hypothetical protein
MPLPDLISTAATDSDVAQTVFLHHLRSANVVTGASGYVDLQVTSPSAVLLGGQLMDWSGDGQLEGGPEVDEPTLDFLDSVAYTALDCDNCPGLTSVLR